MAGSPEMATGASETSTNSSAPQKTSGRFKRGLRVPVPSTRGGTQSIGSVAGHTLWAGGTARVDAPPRALWPLDASLEQDMKKENSGKNSKIKRSKNIPLWHMTPPPALLFSSPKAVGNTETNLKWK